MSDYSYARKIPTGWESLAADNDTVTFWKGVSAEVTRLAIDPTNLVLVAAVRDRHLAFNEFVKALPSEMWADPTGVVTDGIAAKTTGVVITLPAADARVALLAAVIANATVVHIVGSIYAATIVSEADSGTNKTYVFSLVEAA